MANKQESEPKMRKIVPLRHDPSKGYGPVPESSDAKIKKVYPKLTLSFKDLPEAKDWKVDETYELELEVKMVGLRYDEYSQEATFEIHEVGIEDEAGEDDEEEEDN